MDGWQGEPLERIPSVPSLKRQGSMGEPRGHGMGSRKSVSFADFHGMTLEHIKEIDRIHRPGNSFFRTFSSLGLFMLLAYYIMAVISVVLQR
mmetsp:Transcript_47627/g.152616  ORF Transcript_47627/g.152616 Transcript_47627/m.152616 type:complete len:92 (+) Transcript_47627:224-499(+)